MRRRTAFLLLVFILCLGIYARPVSAATPSISSKKVYIKAGGKKQLKIKGASGKISWKSSNKKVASVSNKGLVTTKKCGSTYITATFKYKAGKKKKKKKLSCKMTVYSMNTETMTIKKGSQASVNLYGTKQEKWISSDPLIATISKSGRIQAVQPGSCTITGSINGISYKRKIKVSGFREDLITLTETGAAATLNLVNESGTKFYTSSNENVDRIVGSQVVTVGPGSCTVTAAVNGVYYTCPVVVKKKSATIFIEYLENYHQYIMAHGDMFIRNFTVGLTSFEKAQAKIDAGETVGITCVVPCRWALYAMGVKRKDGNALLSCNNGTFKGQYTGGMVETFDHITSGEVVGLSVKTAVDRGLLRKGDIIGFKGKTHTFVYSGNGYMVYEGGSSCLKNGHYPNGITQNYGVGSYRLNECKISEIMRWKE